MIALKPAGGCGSGSVARLSSVQAADLLIIGHAAGSAKPKQGPGLIASQSEIKDVKVAPHVSAVCRSGERQHPELESETIYYLGNRLVVAIGNFGHAWLQENLPISGK